MIVAAGGSCAYCQCDSHGHCACTALADHYTRLVAASRALLDRLDTPDRDELAQEVRAILAENPPTSKAT